jgi:hypothetical protein
MHGTPDEAERAVRAHIDPSLAADLDGYRSLISRGDAGPAPPNRTPDPA